MKRKNKLSKMFDDGGKHNPIWYKLAEVRHLVIDPLVSPEGDLALVMGTQGPIDRIVVFTPVYSPIAFKVLEDLLYTPL